MLKILLGLAVILGASRLLLYAMGVMQRRLDPPPEVIRKLMHAGMGTVLLLCPCFFDRAWPVVLLAAVFVGLLIAREYLPFLHRHVSHVIYGVERHSLGEFYFPMTTAVLFLLARGRCLEFYVPMMLLTYADAAAAIVGKRYGRCVFETPGGRKSAEGCAAFFVTAFALTAIPLLLQGGAGVTATLLIALNIALVTTFLEAGSWHGWDNVTVPLAAWAMLRWLPTFTGVQFAATVGVGGIVMLIHSLRTTVFPIKPARGATGVVALATTGVELRGRFG